MDFLIKGAMAAAQAQVAKNLHDKQNYNPFRLTSEERAEMDPNYKKPKKKHRTWRSEADSENSSEDLDRQTRLHYKETKSWRLKKRALENVYDLFDDFDDVEDDEDAVEGELPEAEAAEEKVSQDAQGDPTYEMANVRRYIVGKQSLSKMLANSREMFLLKYSLSVKQEEKKRLEEELRNEEIILQKMESELRLAEQAFDQFLQENDRKAVGAMKSAELETRLRLEKATALKQVDNRIIALKRDINKLKDILAEYGTYERFLYSLSPEAWKQMTDESQLSDTMKTFKEWMSSGSRTSKGGESMDSTSLSKMGLRKWKKSTSKSRAQSPLASVSSRSEEKSDEKSKEMEKEYGEKTDTSHPTAPPPTRATTRTPTESSILPSKSETEKPISIDKDATIMKVMTQYLHMPRNEFAKVKGSVKIYFQQPQQLLSIFTDLEDENLKLIQECREEEGNLEKIRCSVRETRVRLTHQASNFEQEIRKVEEKISQEKEAEADLIKLQAERAHVDESAAEAKRAEDKILRELGKLVRSTYVLCLGPLDQEVSTMDLLKRIELKMEQLTQQLERLPPEKVKISQRTCERERRQREHEAKMERQRQIEADRNKKALDRALAKPFVKTSLRNQYPYNRLSYEEHTKALLKARKIQMRSKAETRSDVASEDN